MADNDLTGWREDQRYVLAELRRLNECMMGFDAKLTTIKEDIAKRNEWSEHVVAELERANSADSDLYNKIDSLKAEFVKALVDVSKNISALNVKSGIWGMLGGLVPALGALFYFIIEKGFAK